MYLDNLKNHPESIVKVDCDTHYYNENRYIYNKHFVNVNDADVCFKGTILRDCSFDGFNFEAGFFKGCIIESCDFMNCSFDKNAFISCYVIGYTSWLYGCRVNSAIKIGYETVSSNEPLYMSLTTLMDAVDDRFHDCNYIATDYSMHEHKRLFKQCFDRQLIMNSCIKKSKRLCYSIFVNCTLYKCCFIPDTPIRCIFIGCTFVDCPFDSDSFKDCILCECRGGYDTTYSVV